MSSTVKDVERAALESGTIYLLAMDKLSH
jgi:hypothetical protein